MQDRFLAEFSGFNDETALKDGALPVFIQIAEHIARHISAGHLVIGAKLSTERDMANHYQVAT